MSKEQASPRLRARAEHQSPFLPLLHDARVQGMLTKVTVYLLMTACNRIIELSTVPDGAPSHRETNNVHVPCSRSVGRRLDFSLLARRHRLHDGRRLSRNRHGPRHDVLVALRTLPVPVARRQRGAARRHGRAERRVAPPRRAERRLDVRRVGALRDLQAKAARRPRRAWQREWGSGRHADAPGPDLRL